MKIGYLGPKGTFSYEAYRVYSKDDEAVEFKTISETVESLEGGVVDKAIVPIENSTQGSVFETIDALIENQDVFIIHELTIPIRHFLLTTENTNISEIQEICSHPQALAQCRKYLATNFPSVITREMTSTIAAIDYLQGKSNIACIANEACSEIYNLKIAGHDIQDEQGNETRFIVVAKQENLNSNNKTSIMFSTQNEPGELYKILGMFNLFEINLSKIESRPAKTHLGEYIFWIDFVGDKKDDHIKILLTQIEKRCSYFRMLGSYSEN